MKRSLILLTIFVLSLAFVSVACKRTVPIQEYSNASVSSYGKFSDAQVADAIVRGGNKAGWQMSKSGPGLVMGVLNNREHSVTVDIPYSQSQYTIKYKSSSNMYMDDGKIHSNYNRWAERLNRHIMAELSAMQK